MDQFVHGIESITNLILALVMLRLTVKLDDLTKLVRTFSERVNSLEEFRCKVGE